MDETAVRKKLCDMLGVSVNASQTEIHKKYSESVKEWHPDRVNHNKELAAIAEKRLKEINQIYECLTNQRQFELYAEKLIKEASRQGASQSAAQSRVNPQRAPAGETKSQQANSSASSKENSAHEKESSASARQAKPDPSVPKPTNSVNAAKLKAENVKIGTFIVLALIVLWVLTNAGFFKESARPSYQSPPSGVVPRPSEAPGAPAQAPTPTSIDRTPPDSSVGPPP